MKIFNGSLMIVILLILLFSIGNAFASDANDLNSTVSQDNQLIDDSVVISQDSSEIEVNDWEDIQYYASLNDKNYILKLKEHTNYYPKNPTSIDNQIIFNNNVSIIGSEGAYIGDSSPNPRNITYAAMKVPDNNGIGISFKGVTFKWIGTSYQPDGIFMVMGGNAINYFDDCYFTDISTNIGHSAILHIKLGDLVLTNCTFINCSNDFGCLSVYNPDDDSNTLCSLARMNVTDSYFEGNYGRTAPGAINNCGILVVRNSTFYKNSAFWWAGAIHTTGGANTTIYDSLFLDNVAGWNGGALYTYSYLQVYNTTFINNNCTTNNGGGAIGGCKYQHAPYIYVQDSFFKGNENTCWSINDLSSGTGRGGAISIMDEGGLEVRNTTFIKNSASYGTAICAISAGSYGSPDVVIVGNKFINHTRAGDVLDIRLAPSSFCEIKDNYYYNNSFEFKKLRLLADEKVDDDVVVHIDAELKSPDSYESDILDTASYDIFVDGVYNKTVIGKTFTLKLKNGKTCKVYAAPTLANSITDEILVGIPKEYVYVSQKSGNDTNDGIKRDSPVRTIEKAIEIAKTKGNIVIMDGTFIENGLTIDYNLNIVGEDNVKFTGSMANTIFTVANNSDFSISNITFDSLVFNTKNTGVLRQSDGYTYMDNCLFNNNYVSGLTGTTLVEAKNIEVYNSNFTNHNNNVHIVLIKSDEFSLDNCIFSNNIAYNDYGYPSLIKTVGPKTGIKGIISDSIFESNTVKSGCIYFGGSASPLTITNTKFIANKVSSKSDSSSGIYIENSPAVRIYSSSFTDNVDLGDKSSVIFVMGSSASVFVSNSIILNNSYQNTFGLVFSASTSSNLNVYKNLDGNWWGNTWENYAVAPKVHSAACNNWIVLNITTNNTDLAINQKALVCIDFFNVADRQGNLSFYDAGNLPEIELDVKAINGALSASKIDIIKGSGTVEYTLESLNGGAVIVNYKDIQSIFKFNWSLIDADIEINVDNVTYGNSTEIMIAVPGDIDENKLVLTINNVSYEFNKAISIPKLESGKYLVNLTYLGDSKYNSKIYEKSFEVKKASPQFSIAVGDAYYGSPVKITLATDSEVTGDVAIKIGEINDQKAISNGKVEFTIANLLANNYTVEAIYLGNGNYLSKNLTDKFNVKKYNSTITISKGNVEIGHDVVLTFTVNADASGNVTVDINGKKENISVIGGSATYTIKNISSGFYTISATYNGDVKYLSSKNTAEIDVGRLNSTLNVDVESITYGEDAVFTITLNDGASGNVTINIDGKNYIAAVNDGKTTLNISDLNAGDKIANIDYSGDFTYLDCQTTKSFNISKAKPTLTIDVGDIKEGKVLNVQITITKGTTGTLEIVSPKGTENSDIPRTGFFTRSISDLTVGEYNISAIYAGDNNYLYSKATETFKVTAWSDPQWPNEGYDSKNTEKSPYASNTNGNIAWITNIEGDMIGNLAIDSEGNVYITTSVGIFSLKNADGSINWIFKSNEPEGNFTGVAISRDMIISPKIGHKLFFINQTTGMALNNNIFQGSSYFAPIVDENANVYISSEYQTTSSSYKLVIIPYNIWEFSTSPTMIDIGKYAPNSAPVLINNNTVAITTENSIKLIDIASKSVFNNFNIVSNVRPVISNNMLYAISGNSVVAIAPDGNMWKVNISGTAGNYLSVGENGEIFSVTKEGVLYEYSTGEEVFIYDFKNNVSQAILVGQNNVLYVGCENGDFYSINLNGDLLWKINLNESLSGKPVMDKNGVIYVISGNRIIAINNAALKDSNMSADVKDGKVNIELDGYATGIISINIGDIYNNESSIENGHVSFDISNLNPGNYSARIDYSGDSRFKSQTAEVKFKVSKILTDFSVEYNNISYGENIIIKVLDLPMDASGIITVNINNNTFSSNISNGEMAITIPDLPAGRYVCEVRYSDDVKFEANSKTLSIEVIKINPSIVIHAMDIKCGENLMLTIDLNRDATGNVIVNIGNISQIEKIIEGNVKFNISNISCGVYDVIVRYDGDNNYIEGQNSTKINVSKVEISVNEDTLIPTDDLTNYGIDLPEDATGTLTVIIDGEKHTVDVVNGKANINIPELSGGSHNISVIYSGDNKYSAIVKSKIVNVPVIELTGKDVSMLYSAGGYYKVHLTQDGSPLVGKTVSITIGGITYQRLSDSNGYASLKITFAPKTYSVTAVYGSLKVKNKVVVKNIINANNVNVKKSSKSIKIKISLKQVNKKYLKGKTISLKFNKKTFKAKTNKKGIAIFTIKNSVYKKLKIGKKYTYQVTYAKNTLKKTIKFKK